MYTTHKITNTSANKISNRIVKEYRCMNCSKIIMNPEGDMYSKRFCSAKCFDTYMEK
ncbi:MAG: hypothetical protein NUV57_00335 [archaeon]|nr:hypothetical protein [archaeon]